MREIVLTDEQKAKVEQNIGLAMFYYKKYKPPIGMDREDWLQEVLYVLCKAVAFHDPEISGLASIMRSLLRNKYSDCKWYFSKFNDIVSIYSHHGDTEAQIANTVECRSRSTGELIDAQDEVQRIMREGTKRWQKAYSAAITGQKVSQSNQAVLTEIRHQCGNSGRVNCCDHCFSVFIGCANGQSRFCSECKLARKRIDARIASSRRKRQNKELVK